VPATLTNDDVLIGGAGRPSEPPRGGDGGDGATGNPTTPRRAYFTVLALGLAGIMMFFMALASAFIVRKGVGADWRALELPLVLWFNTLVLVVSSMTIEVARKQFAAGKVDSFRGWWALTTGLGLAFLGGQYLAWGELAASGIFLATNPSSSFFYVFTAAHAVHIVGGLTALGYVAARGIEHHRRRQGLAADLAAVYWHFMDGLWVFLFLLLFLGR